MNKKKEWLRTIIWLKRTFPPQRPISVRTRPIKGDCGSSGLYKRRFTISITDDISFDLKIEVLLHEWAHCLTHFCANQEEEHSDEFGLTWVRIYRAFLVWWKEDAKCQKT